MPPLPNSREWNAVEYDRLSQPQLHWGQRVLSRLQLRGDECVLDAGCGVGKLTRMLLEKLPRGRVVGLDLSQSMVRYARQNLHSDFADRVAFVAADLVALPFRRCFEGIFSTASFHWVKDHDTLWLNLMAALRPAGWLHAQCGGGPNLARLRQRIREVAAQPEFFRWLGEFPEPWFFSDAEGASVRLREAGFVDVETGLEPAPVTLSSREEFQDYLRSVVVHRHLERLPAEPLRRAFVEKLTEACAHDDPPWTLDYWRLNLHARRQD